MLSCHKAHKPSTLLSRILGAVNQDHLYGGWAQGGGGGGGGGKCVFRYKNVCRNSVNCRFGAVYLGKKPVMFHQIFPGEVPISPLKWLDFSWRKNPVEFEGKNRIQQYTTSHEPNITIQHLNFYENKILKEPRISVARAETFFDHYLK